MDIKDFIERFAGVIEVEDASSLTATTKFRELEEWSSISIMLLIAFYDEELNKEIGGSDIRECHTIQELYNLAFE